MNSGPANITAVVKPMPDELPVTNATLFLPVISIFSVTSNTCIDSLKCKCISLRRATDSFQIQTHRVGYVY